MIVVDTDGSPGAALALDTALSLAEDGEAFVAVTAWQERGDFGLPYERLIAPDIADIERVFADRDVTNPHSEPSPIRSSRRPPPPLAP